MPVSTDQRPPAGELLQQLEAAKAQVEGPYGQIVKVNLDLEKVRVLREKDTQIRRLQQQVQQVEVGGTLHRCMVCPALPK